MFKLLPLLTYRMMCTRAGEAGSENAEQRQEASATPKPEQTVTVQRPQTHSLQVGTWYCFLATA
jgi:hypothetical protein